MSHDAKVEVVELTDLDLGLREDSQDQVSDAKDEDEVHIHKVPCAGGGVLLGPKTPHDQLVEDRYEIKWSGKFLENPRFMDDQPWANLHTFFLWDKFRVFLALCNMISLTVSAHVPDYKAQLGGFGGSTTDGSGSISAMAGLALQAIQWVEVFTMILLLFTFRRKKTRWNFIFKFFDWLLEKLHNGNPPFVPMDYKGNVCLQISMSIAILIQLVISRSYILLQPGATPKDLAIIKMCPIVWTLMMAWGSRNLQ
jgi:hypothetical protein